MPLDKKRLEMAQQQVSEDFFTPPLFADWISFTNLWYPALQGIILGDTTSKRASTMPSSRRAR